MIIMAKIILSNDIVTLFIILFFIIFAVSEIF